MPQMRFWEDDKPHEPSLRLHPEPLRSTNINDRSKNNRMRRNDADREVVAIGRFIGSAPRETIEDCLAVLEQMSPDEAAEFVCQLVLSHG